MMVLKKFGLAALLMACMMNAFAYQGNTSGTHEAAVERRLDWLYASEARRDEARDQRREERQRGREARQYADGQYPGGLLPEGGHEDARRGGRMTPEERRALRRQIDEAGRDIYRPRR